MTLHPSSNVDCSKKTEKVESGVKRTPQSAPKLSQRSRPWLKQKFSNLQTSAHNQFTHTLHMILISYLIWGSEQKPDQRNSHLQTELTQFPNQSWPQKDKEQKLPAQEQGTWNVLLFRGPQNTTLFIIFRLATRLPGSPSLMTWLHSYSVYWDQSSAKSLWPDTPWRWEWGIRTWFLQLPTAS